MAASDTAKLIASLQLVDKFTKPLQNATKGLTAFDRKLGQTEGRAFKAGQQIGTGFKNAAKIVAAASVTIAAVGAGIFIKSIEAASDLGETISKVGVVFKSQTDRIRAFGKTSAAALGLSENAALAAAATYGNLFVSMGLAEKTSADMSLRLVQLASDLASFNNIDPTEALEKLRAGLTGEAEPLKSLGININETILKNKALELGLVTLEKGQKKYTAVLEPAVKAQAAYALILEQSGTAQGDFSRTSDGLANQTRILRANWEDLKATLATPALPRVASIFKRINDLVKANQPEIAKLGDKIADLFSDANVAQGANVIKGVFTTIQSLLPAIQSGAEVTGRVITTAVNAFKSLPPEIQALAVAGLAINKLTGGLVTNLAGGLIGAVLSSFKGLMHVNAGVVQVTGAGGAMPVTPAGSAGWAALFALIGPAVVAALASKEITDSTNREFGAAGIPTNFMAPGSGRLPFGIEASLNNLGEIFRISYNKLTGAVDNTSADLRTADRHLGDVVDGIDNTSAELRTADRHITSAIDNNTSRLAAAFKKPTAAQAAPIIEADRRARGIKGPGISTSLEPRFQFLRGARAGGKDAAVSAAIATGFERGATPLFRNTALIPKSIRELEADQRQLLKAGDTKNAALIGGHISRLRAELGRRQETANSKLEQIANKATDVKVNTSLNSTTFLNGRLISANLERFQTVFSSAGNIGGRGPR